MKRQRIEQVVVVLPAHDEEERIVDALGSLRRAAERSPVPVSVIVVLDACSDRTEGRVRRFSDADRFARLSVIEVHVRRASSARQHGLDHYIADLDDSVSPSQVAVLSADADTVVPADWIARHLTLLDAGFDAVAGIVDLDDDDDDHGVDCVSWWAEYSTSFTATGGHSHVHCANLAVRLSALLVAGGFGHARRAEDIDLWRRLDALPESRLLQTQLSTVLTSGRRIGRVDGGFATALEQFRDVEPVA